MKFSVLGLPESKPTVGSSTEDYASWLGVTQQEDAAACIAALGIDEPDWIVADHYGLDAEWESRVRSRARHVMAIDDLENRNHACDLLLDQNLRLPGEKQPYAGLVPAGAHLLLGPRYALLRAEYAQQRNRRSAGGGSLRRVLVFFGGTDPHNFTGATLEALSRPGLRHLSVDVVVGVNNANRQILQRQAANRPDTTLHGPLPHLALLMSECDLAVGAGGTTSWERMCVGLPSLVVSTAENQRPLAEALAQQGLIRYLGNSGQVGTAEIAVAMDKAVAGELDLAGLSLQGALAVDGLGAMRVAECMDPTGQQELALRGAQAADAGLFFSWVNDPEVRRQSLNTHAIPWPVHEQWFRSRIVGRTSRMFVLEAKSLPVGQIRFDMSESEALINFSVDSQFRGRGWGGRLVALGVSRMAESGRLVFCAEVKRSNPVSAAVFARLGFRESQSRNEGELRIFRFDSGVDSLADSA